MVSREKKKKKRLPLMPVGIMNDEVAKAALSEGHNAAALNRKAFRKAGRQGGRGREAGCVCVCVLGGRVWGSRCWGLSDTGLIRGGS